MRNFARYSAALAGVPLSGSPLSSHYFVEDLTSRFIFLAPTVRRHFSSRFIHLTSSITETSRSLHISHSTSG